MKLRRHKNGSHCIPYAPTRWITPEWSSYRCFTHWDYRLRDRVYPYACIKFWKEETGDIYAVIDIHTEIIQSYWTQSASDDLPPEFVEFMDEHFMRKEK